MRKNKQFSIRISAQDLETIRQKAVQAHMSQSDYVVSCCLGKKIIILDGLKEILRQQKAIGNNLNQMTVLANMGKVQFANLDSAVQAFAKINTALRELQEGGATKSRSSADLAGHGDTSFLERTYCHPQMQLKQEAAKRMSNSLFATPNPELLVS